MTSKIVVNNIEADAGVSTVTFNSNVERGTSNLHSVGLEAAGINVLGADTPIGTGATIYDDGGARFSGIVSATKFVGSIDLTSETINLDDSSGVNNNRIKIGTGSDLQIYHGSNQNYVSVVGDGNLNLTSATSVVIKTATSKDAVVCNNGGSTDLYHNNNKKFETTSTGAKVTGNLQFASAGQGIDFSASAHSSGQQSELLDDYERGSWTPQFWNARTGGTQLTNPSNTQANYVKVGRIVYLHLGVHGLTKNWAGSNTQIFIRGIPYRSYFQHNGHCVRVGYFGGGSMGNDDMNVYANLRQYDTYMELQKSGGAQGRYEALYWSDIHWEGYGNLTCEMVYETDQGV